MIDEGTETDAREMQALTHSKKIRAGCQFWTERAVKNRKAFYTAENTGYFHKEVTAPNPMNMMANPDMMN